MAVGLPAGAFVSSWYGVPALAGLARHRPARCLANPGPRRLKPGLRTNNSRMRTLPPARVRTFCICSRTHFLICGSCGPVDRQLVIQGRAIRPDDVALIRTWLESHPIRIGCGYLVKCDGNRIQFVNALSLGLQNRWVEVPGCGQESSLPRSRGRLRISGTRSGFPHDTFGRPGSSVGPTRTRWRRRFR